MRPEWLPLKLTLSGTLENTYSALHDHYLNNIVNQVIEVEGVPVRHNHVLDPANPPYTYGFTHLITREISNRLRVYDPNRAEKLSWVVPLLENYKDPCVSCFWFETPRGAILQESLAIWLEEMDYILVLRWVSITQTEKIVVTAHSVDTGNRNYWQRKRLRATSRRLHF